MLVRHQVRRWKSPCRCPIRQFLVEHYGLGRLAGIPQLYPFLRRGIFVLLPIGIDYEDLIHPDLGAGLLQSSKKYQNSNYGRTETKEENQSVIIGRALKKWRAIHKKVRIRPHGRRWK